jgi:hypothetical protein
MKKLLLILTLTASSFAFASATTIDPVNQRALKSFNTDFSTANDVKWVAVAGEDMYQVTFKFNNEEVIAIYNSEGELLSTARYIVKEALPIMVATELNKQYKNYIIRTVIERTANGETSYFVTLESEKSSLIVNAKPSGHISVYKKLAKPVFEKQ